MDSPERRAPIKPNWGGIMSSPGSAAFMDLCDSLSPIRPVPTFHASTFNELNQMRSPASPNFPTRRLKERRLTNSSASALLLAATTDEAPKTPGLFKREPLRQTFGRNLSRIGDANGELSYSSEATETPSRKKQVLVVQRGGVVGDLDSNGKDEAVDVVLPSQQELALERDSAALKARKEGLVSRQAAEGREAEQKAIGSKRDREDPQHAAGSQPRTVSPSFLKSLRAYAQSPPSSVLPVKQEGESAPIETGPNTAPVMPTPSPPKSVLTTATPNQPASAPLQPQSGIAAETSNAVLDASTAPTPPSQEEQAAKRQKKAEDALALAVETADKGAGLHRELSFAVPAVSSGRDTNSAAALSDSAAQPGPPSPKPSAVTSAEGAPTQEVAQRQTRSRTTEKSAQPGRGGAGSGVLPKGKRSAVHRKKSRFPVGGEDSSAAEASSDDTERTVSEGLPSGEARAQAMPKPVQGGEGLGEAGSAKLVTGRSQAEESNAEQLLKTPPVAKGEESGKGAADSEAESPRRPSPPRETTAAEGNSVRHSSPPRTTILPQLKGVRSPRKGVRRGQETPTKSPANAAAPGGAPGGQDTVEDLAQLLVDLSEGRTPEKLKRQPSGGEGTPTSNLARQDDKACTASVGRLARGPTSDCAEGGNAVQTNGTGTGVKVEEAAQAVSFEQEVTPRSAMFVDGKIGASLSPGGNTGRARRLNFDADAARRQSLTAQQDPRLSLEAQGSWPGFSAAPSLLGSPAQSPIHTSPPTGRTMPQTNNETPQSGPIPPHKTAGNEGSTLVANQTTPQSGRSPPEMVTVKQEVVERPLQTGQKRVNSEDGGNEREAKRERSSGPDGVFGEVKPNSDGVYSEVKDTSDATAVALSAAMGALSACQTFPTCQAANGGHSHQAAVSGPVQQTLGRVPAQVRQAQGPASLNRPGTGGVRQGVVSTAVNGAAVVRTPQQQTAVVRYPQQQTYSTHTNSAHTNPGYANPGHANPAQTPPMQYLSGNQSGAPPNQVQQQRFYTPPQQYAQPAQGPARNRNPSPANRPRTPVTSAATSASAVTSSALPFDPNVAIVPKPPPPAPQPRAAKSLNLARIGAGLNAGTVVRVTPGVAPTPQETPNRQYQTGGQSKRASYPPMQRTQTFTTTRFPGYSHYTPSYQKAPPPRQPGPNYQAVSMPFGQPQQPSQGVSPAIMQRQKMEAAIDRREAQRDPLSELELDLDLGMELMVVPESPPQPKKASGTCKRCHCKKSKCLKLYCECFAANVYCTGCDCVDCQNRPEFEDIVMQKKEEIEKKDPHAFAPKIVEGESPSPTKGETPASAKHKKGCHCKKSMCQKKYCECFQANVACTDACRCENCANEYGKKGHSHGPHCDPAGWAAAAAASAPADAPDSRSPATPGFGRISIQRTYPGGGKMVAKKQSLDPYGDEISALDFPHHHPTKEKPQTPLKVEPDTSAPPPTSAPPATSAKGRGRKKEPKSDLKTVRETQSGAAEQTSSGMFPSLSSSPARWSLGAPDFSTPSSYYHVPSSPTNRRGSDTTEFLHLPSSPSPSFGSGPLLRTGTGMGATPPLHARVRSTPLGAAIWNPADLATRSPERRNPGHGMQSPQKFGGNGMLKLSNLSSGYYQTGKDTRSAVGDEQIDDEGNGFDTGYANPAGLTCDESVDLDDSLAESLFREPCGYGSGGDLLSYDHGQMDLTYSDDMYESPKGSAPMSPPPKAPASAPAFVSLKNLTGGSGRHLTDYPDDPSAALLSPHDGKRRRLSTGRGVEDTFAIVGGDKTPIRMSKAGSPTKIVAPTYAWGESPGRGRTVTPGRKSLNLSNLPSLPALPGRLSGGEGSGLYTQEAVQQRAA